MITQVLTTKQGINALRYYNSSNPQLSLVFTSGIAGGIQAWQPLIKILLKTLPNIECISYDLRWHGESVGKLPNSGSDNNFCQMLAHDLSDVVDIATNNDSLVLIGHSIGGFICQEAVLLNKKLQFARLILVCSSPQTQLSRLGHEKFCYQVARLILPKEKKLQNKTVLDFFRYKNTGDFYLPRLISDIRYIGLPTFLAYWLGGLTYKNQRIATINSERTLYIYGKHDHILSKKYQKKILKMLSKVKRVCINTNHIAVLNATHDLAQQIIRFLK